MNHPKKSPRIIIIDALRGFALAGVALVHMIEQYIAGPMPAGLMDQVNGMPDQIITGIVMFLCSGKFFSLFSILFGLSFYIQMESAARKGKDFSLRFLWRGILLLGIGYAHQLFYRGDILTIYAFLVPFLIPFEKLSNKWILGVAILFFLGLPRFISFAVWGENSLFGLSNEFFNPAETAYFETLQSGSLVEVFQQNVDYGMKTKMNYQLRFFGRFYYTFGYFLFGLWLGKMGVFRKLPTFVPDIKKLLKWSGIGFLVAAILTGITFGTAPQPIDFSNWYQIIAYNFSDWTSIAMTLIIACAFLLLYQKEKWEQRLSFFAPYGRMALTNYVLQSLIGTFILFGWGLGLMGQIRSIYLILIAIAMIIAQTYFSKIWLQYFKYGPLEWLWRCGTYLKWQPFLKQ